MTVRYTNYITFAWLRSDGDYEIVGTLNGETVEDDALWNNTVRVMLMLLKAANDDTEAYQREDVVAVLIPDEDEVWTPLTFNP